MNSSKMLMAILYLFIIIISMSCKNNPSDSTQDSLDQNNPQLKGWVRQQSPTNTRLLSIYFLDQYLGWACGDSGTIVKTIDGGKSWNIQLTGSKRYLRSISFSNSNNGWIVGDSGIILKTTNSGLSWLAQSSPTTYSLNAISAIDNDNVIVVGDLGLILKTTNGGNSWIRQISNTYSYLYGLRFMTDSIGYAVGFAGSILKTTNIGSTWFSQTSNVNGTLSAICFLTKLKACTAGQEILISADSGSHWTTAYSSGAYQFTSLAFEDSLKGWAVGVYGTIFSTSDGGNTWNYLSLGITAESFLCVFFLNSEFGWIVGSNGIILKYYP